MIISRDLIKDVKAASAVMQNDTTSFAHTPVVLKLTLIVALLEGLIKRDDFDALIAFTSTPRLASEILNNNTQFKRILSDLKRRIRSTSFEGADSQFINELIAYSETKRFPGQNIEVGHPQAQLTADLILGTSVGNTPSSMPTSPAGSNLDMTDKALIAGGTAAVATALETQAQMVTGQVMGDISTQVSNAIGGGINTANQSIGKAINSTLQRMKTFLHGSGSMTGAATGTGPTPGALEKLANIFKGKTPSEMVLPAAVILAVGLGGAFGWRRYIRHRKNQRLARELARDTELRRQMERLVAESGMSKYAGQPEAVDAVRAVETTELRQPYMRGY